MGEDTVKLYRIKMKTVTIELINPTMDKNNKMILDWRVIGSDSHELNDSIYDETKNGFFHGAIYDENTNQIMMNYTVKHKPYFGIKLPKDCVETFKSLYENLSGKQNYNFTKVVDDLISGQLNIEFQLMKLKKDKPFYKAWLPYLADIDKSLVMQDEMIFESALRQLMYKKGIKKYIGCPSEFIEKTLNQKVGNIREMNPALYKFEFDKNIQKEYGCDEHTVTGFEMMMPDVIKLIKWEV